jgi:hypothetical protein
MAHSSENDSASKKRPWSNALQDSDSQGQPASPKSLRVSEEQAPPHAAGSAGAAGAPLTAAEACE